MTAAQQGSLFADPDTLIYRCHRCGPTPHQILHTYPNGQHMVRCTSCRTGATTQ